MSRTSSKIASIALASVFAALLACGCAKPPDPVTAQPPATANGKPPAPPAVQNSSGPGVTPMGGVGAGPMTPVAGSDSVAGGGSGVGSMMKEKAKAAAKNESEKTASQEDTGQ